MSDVLELANQAIQALFTPGDVVELRVLGTRGGRKGIVAAGYFDNFELLAKAVVNCSEHAPKGYLVEGVYYTLNPCNPDLMARYANRMQRDAGLTTSDREILKRKHLLIDCDPVRPSGISSSDAEKELAAKKAGQIKEYLTSRAFPECIECDSGNGHHLIYRIDLPNDDASRDLIKSCLVSLASKFDDATVKIDQSVFNSARITKAYGSVARKGDNYGARPHRRSRMLVNPYAVPNRFEQAINEASITLRINPDNTSNVDRHESPEEMLLKGFKASYPGWVASGLLKDPNTGLVDPHLLQLLASEAPIPELPESNNEVSPEKFEEQLALVGLEFDECQTYNGGFRWHLANCVFDPSHVRTAIIVGMRAGGAFYYHCSHSSCQGLTWKHFREQVEKVTGKKMKFRETSDEVPDSLVLLRLKSDVKGWDAYNGKLESFNSSLELPPPEQAYQYLIQAFKRCGTKDGKQFQRLFQASPLRPLYEETVPSFLRS